MYMNQVPWMILGSLQAHASKALVEGGVSPTIGCTDLSLPKIIEYDKDS
jgi:hypothetical protein